jgi:hypothetical protein
MIDVFLMKKPEKILADAEETSAEETIEQQTEAMMAATQGPRIGTAGGGANVSTSLTGGTSTGRKHGEPSPGHRRRTKVEMAEDRAYFAAHPQEEPQTQDGLSEEDAAAISSGEERINPEDAPSETEQSKSSLTHDDLRAAVGRFSKKFGIAKAQATIPGLIGGPIIEIPSDKIGDTIAAVERATNEAPMPYFEPTPEPAPLFDEPEKTEATIDDVNEAIFSYARKYDGSAEPAKMKVTMVDVPKILQGLFGAEVVKPRRIPPSPQNFGVALSAINKAITDNPYKRAAK